MHETCANSSPWLEARGLLGAVVELFERAAQPLLPGAQEPVKLLVRYLRRKPGRGLVVIYSVDEDHSTTKTHTQGAQRWVSVTLAEHMQDLACVLIVLYAAVERFGAPQYLITDNGAVF